MTTFRPGIPQRRWLSRGVLAVVASILLISCGVPVDRSATPIDDPALLAPLSPPVSSDTGEQGGPSTVTVFLLQGGKLVRRTRSAEDTINGVESALISGLTNDDRTAGLTTALQRVDLHNVIDDGGGRYTIDTSPIGLDGTQLTLAHAQLALTAFEIPSVRAVRFSENGKLVPGQTPRATKKVSEYVNAVDYSDIAPAPTTTSSRPATSSLPATTTIPPASGSATTTR
jgi:hypothetical protein